MPRKYTVALCLALAAILACLPSCSRARKAEAPPAPGGKAPASRSPSAPAATGEKAPSRPPARTPAEPEARALPVDMLIGGRPLDRIAAEDYTLGPMQDVSGIPAAPSGSAAGAVRHFLEELAEGRLDAPPDSRDILELALADLLSGRVRVTGWRMGAGIPRPEGGYAFPVLLAAGDARTVGEVLAGFQEDSRWAVELVLLDAEELQGSPETAPGPFDPTIRTARRKGR